MKIFAELNIYWCVVEFIFILNYAHNILMRFHLLICIFF